MAVFTADDVVASDGMVVVVVAPPPNAVSVAVAIFCEPNERLDVVGDGDIDAVTFFPPYILPPLKNPSL